MTSSLVKGSRWFLQLGVLLAVLVMSTGVTWAQGECNEQCYTPLASAGANFRLVLETVRFDDTDYIIVRNLSGDDISFEGWQLCQEQTCVALPADNPLAHGARMTIHLNEAGSNSASDVYIETFSPLEPAAGEIAIFNSADLESMSSVVAYVRWGAAAGEGSREAIAMRQWETGSFVPICPELDHVGIRAVGDVSIVRGWKGQPFGCW